MYLLTRVTHCHALLTTQEFEFEESLRRDREKQRAKEEADAIEASRLAEVERQQQAEAQREQLAAERVPAEPDASDKVRLCLSYSTSSNIVACIIQPSIVHGMEVR